MPERTSNQPSNGKEFMTPMKLLNQTETARLLHVSPTTVAAMLRRGQLAGFSTGTVTRITLSSVKALVGDDVFADIARGTV